MEVNVWYTFVIRLLTVSLGKYSKVKPVQCTLYKNNPAEGTLERECNALPHLRYWSQVQIKGIGT